jgi:hypothetical protein
MSQMSFSDVEFGAKRKQTRREKFLFEMDAVIPWARLVRLIELRFPLYFVYQRVRFMLPVFPYLAD